MAIAVISFLVWGHHMFVTGQSVYAGLIFSVLSFLVAIPSAIKVFNWTSTLYKGSISYEAPMLYALGFIGLFTMGGLTGLFLASLATDVHLNGTYFIVAHFHYIMVGGAVMGYLGGIHFWWPKITGRLYPDAWARFAALVVFVGFNLTFFPQFMLGYLGMPRRYAVYPQEFQVLNVMSSAGASILGIGYLIPLIYLIWSMRYGPAAGPNPWGARGLEWEDAFPAADRKFRGNSGGHRRSVQLHRREANSWLIWPIPRSLACLGAPVRDQGAAARCRKPRHVGFPGHRNHVLRRRFHGVHRVSRAASGSVHQGSHILERDFRSDEYGRADLQQLDDGAGHSARRRRARANPRLSCILILTMLLGMAFLLIKFNFEWHHDWVEGLVPGLHFTYSGPHAPGVQLFFCFYFFMTGLHALHMFIGSGF